MARDSNGHSIASRRYGRPATSSSRLFVLLVFDTGNDRWMRAFLAEAIVLQRRKAA
jgi:hypothetical protein